MSADGRMDSELWYNLYTEIFHGNKVYESWLYKNTGWFLKAY